MQNIMFAGVKNKSLFEVKSFAITSSVLISLIIALSIAMCVCNSSTQSAEAVDVTSAQNDLASAKAQLTSANAEYEQAMAEASSLQTELNSATESALESQSKMLQEQESLNAIATYEYRNGETLPYVELILGSTSFDSLIKNIDYANFVMQKKQAAIQASKEAKEQFDKEVENLNAKYDSYKTALETASEKQALANAIVEKASSTLSAAEAEELKNQQSQSAQPSTPTPTPTPTPEGGWKSGEASAYNGTSTASGEPITQDSLGVAIPMSWPNYKSLFGHTVQIKLHGKVVLARINDCGGFGGNRVLDVQPGVCHAFGYANEYAWGVQDIEYRIL